LRASHETPGRAQTVEFSWSNLVAEIEFHDVCFSRPDASQPILDGLTFHVNEGEVLALIGRSGSGKTTILRMMNGLLLPTRGTVLVEGRDTRAWAPFALRRRTGYVLQEVGLFPHMTIGQNVGIVPRLVGWPADRAEARVQQLLDLVGLAPASFADRWPDELSGGQRQRAGVARALAVDPPVLLMDEPFGALDPITRAEMQAEFRRIQSGLRKTVAIVTHDMDEALALGDRLAVIDAGRLVALDPPGRIERSIDPRVRALLDARTSRLARGAPADGARP
jgi:osmoprotectant transport system ATP-binding protein